jgi:hypothetical protein
MISQQALKEFKAIWKEEYGNDIPDDFALERAVNLLTLMDAIYHPIKKEWLNEYDYQTHKKNYNQQENTKAQERKF